MPRPRHRYVLVPGCFTLERRLAPSALFAAVHSNGSEPLPDPEPSPGPDPGMDTPVAPPPLPPSGPVGPGTT